MADWTPAGLKLFKNESDVPQEILYKPLRIWKGFDQVILSRTFIESIFDKLNLERIMKLIDQDKFYGVDEMLVQTLYRNYLGLEGQPTSNCKNTVPDTVELWRDWTIEQHSQGKYLKSCKSKFERHWICIMGVEYLPDFLETNFVIGNKILETYDVGPAVCSKEIFQRNKIKKEDNKNGTSKLSAISRNGNET
ncbi:unnamed protein product [Caenorhabditis angaria]|uniref:Uncharacterized protein n=1 Tax=Caenorhabditis angaria TaxID=860376 RepID=A0A9P1N6X3_9PELO|nr:unnamed protein product [Caenorhabditis angaria]